MLSGTTVFLFNAPRYALGLPFVPSARDDDGWLDLLIFRDPGPFQALYYLWKVLWGTHLDLPSVFHRRVKTAFVTADDTVPIQIDGDPGGFLQKSADARAVGVAAGPAADGTADGLDGRNRSAGAAGVCAGGAAAAGSQGWGGWSARKRRRGAIRFRLCRPGGHACPDFPV